MASGVAAVTGIIDCIYQADSNPLDVLHVSNTEISLCR